MSHKNKIALVIHGGAGPDSNYIKENRQGYVEGLKKSLAAGYRVLEEGGSALDAVETAVREMENDLLFNAGRGSALNSRGEVEMDASIMDGEKVKAGAVSIVKNVTHPVTLARVVMNHTNHVLLSGYGAMEVAKINGVELEPEAYFVSPHQFDLFTEERNTKSMRELLKKRVHGTVGAVALDNKGNLAAGTSTGGTTNSLPGRVGDSCLIGAGCYANNNTCAVSGTGDGEILINGVIAHSVSAAIEYTKCTMQEACDFIVHEKNKDVEGDIGVISLSASGDIGISFNSERMHRAWMSSDVPLHVGIYTAEEE